MIYVLKIIWDYRVSLLELIVRNIARYPQSATSTPIRYQPAIRYLLPWLQQIIPIPRDPMSILFPLSPPINNVESFP
jgi:hypothetical protein